MARRPRIYFPGALYHVIARGNQKQDIFLDEIGFRTYLFYLSEYKSKHSFYLYGRRACLLAISGASQGGSALNSGDRILKGRHSYSGEDDFNVFGKSLLGRPANGSHSPDKTSVVNGPKLIDHDV